MGPRKKVLVGSVLCSVLALQALTVTGQHSGDFLSRHEAGDWGDGLNLQEYEDNERAIGEGLAVASAYLLSNGETLWILSDAGGIATRLLLGSEF